MKKLILSAQIIATMTFACQHDSADQVISPSTSSSLSADELQVATNTGRLASSAEVFSQAIAYQKANPTSTASVTISRAILETILGQSHTVGIRAYYVKNSEGKLDLTLVGIDKNLNNRYVTNAIFSEGKVISEATVKQQMDLFQTENPTAIRAVAFGSQVLLAVLNRASGAGLRFYFITDKDGKRNLMFIGIDSQLKDLRNTNPNARTSDDGDAGTDGPICPRHC